MTDIRSNSRYYDRLYRKLTALRDQSARGFDNPFRASMSMTVAKQSWIKQFLTDQIAMIEATFVIPTEFPALNLDQPNSWRNYDIFTTPLKRRVGVQLPTGLVIISPYDMSSRDSSHHGVFKVIRTGAPATDGRIRTYHVARLRDNSNSSLATTRYAEKLYIPYALLCEYKGMLAALNRMQTQHAGVMARGEVRFEHLYNYAKQDYPAFVFPDLPSGTTPSRRGELSAKLLGTRLMESKLSSTYGTAVQFGAITNTYMGVLFNQALTNGSVQDGERRRDYDRMLAKLIEHSRNMSAHFFHRFYGEYTGNMQDPMETRILAHTRGYTSKEDIAWLKQEVATRKQRYSDLTYTIKHARKLIASGDMQAFTQWMTRSRWSDVRANLEIIRSYREFSSYYDHANYDNLYYDNGVHAEALQNTFVAFFERLVRVPYGFFAEHDRRIFPRSMGSVVVSGVSRQGDVTDRIILPPWHEERITEIDGVQYMVHLLHTWSDGSRRFYPEPPAIGGYHSSKNLVGFMKTAMEPPYLGMELEIGLQGMEGDSPRHNVARQLKAAVNYSTDSLMYACCENDGSIGYGFEIVTGHTGLDVHQERIAKMLPVIDANFNDDGRQGLHVHICKQGASLQHQARMDKFVHSTANAKLIRDIARRDANNYNRQHSNKNSIAKLVEIARGVVRHYRDADPKARMRKLREHKASMSQSLCHERYDMLNFKNEHTIEFRMFRTSKDLTEVMACLEFAYNLWHFCKERRNDELFTPMFLNHINDKRRRKETKHLRKYLANLGHAVYQSNPNKQAATTAVAA